MRAKLLSQVNRQLKGEFLDELENKQGKLTTKKEEILNLVIKLMDTPSSRLAELQKTHPNVDEARQFLKSEQSRFTSEMKAADPGATESFRRVIKLANLVGEVNSRTRLDFEETGNPKKGSGKRFPLKKHRK